MVHLLDARNSYLGSISGLDLTFSVKIFTSAFSLVIAHVKNSMLEYALPLKVL